MYKLLVIFLLISVISRAQLKKIELPEAIHIGEASIVGTPIARLYYIPSNNDTTYYLQFNNAKYTTLTDIQSISFENTQGILDSLFNILGSALEMQSGKQFTIMLGKETLSIKEERTMGMKFITIMKISNGAFFSLRRKQLNDLFNRK